VGAGLEAANTAVADSAAAAAAQTNAAS
jgi:hypothetical protein